MNQLVKYEAARQALAVAKSVDEVKDIKDKAEAMRLYAKQAKDIELETTCAEIKLRAQRRIGEISKELEKAPSGRAAVSLPASGKSKKDTLKSAGISTSAAQRYEEISDVEEKDFETYVDGKKKKNQPVSAKELVKNVLAPIRREAKINKINAGNLELPSKTYNIIYADPPWKYENPPNGDSSRSIENHYPTMELKEIRDLPVKKMSAPDSLLYLWATAPKLAECLEVMKSWGFEYRTNFVWVKDKIGMGYHARSQHELLLVGKRGEIPPPAVDDRVSSVIFADRGKHSEKPVEFAELIESFYPTLPKIELFARSPREGWEVWGNQSDGS